MCHCKTFPPFFVEAQGSHERRKEKQFIILGALEQGKRSREKQAWSAENEVGMCLFPVGKWGGYIWAIWSTEAIKICHNFKYPIIGSLGRPGLNVVWYKSLIIYSSAIWGEKFWWGGPGIHFLSTWRSRCSDNKWQTRAELSRAFLARDPGGCAADRCGAGRTWQGGITWVMPVAPPTSAMCRHHRCRGTSRN